MKRKTLGSLFVFASPAGRRSIGPHAARMRLGSVWLACRIGRTGVRTAKREGDGASPRATLRAVRGFWRSDRRWRPAATLPMRAIRPGDGWCEVPGDRNYNRLVKKPYAASHEDMMRKDALYDVVLDLDWNRVPRKHGAGSAIFLHLARGDGGPTAGCIGIPTRFIDFVVGRIGPKTRIVIG